MSVARYREHPLHPGLRDHVEAAWSVTADGPVGAHLVVPDGCIDLVDVDGAVHVAGPTTAPVAAALPTSGAVRGLRFRPGAAPSLLGVAAHELRGLHVPLAQVWGRDIPYDGLQELLTRRLRGTDPVVDGAVARLRAAPGTAVATLAREAAISERQLRRRFHDHVGYGPRRLGRVLRLQRVLALGRAGGAGARLAADAGYADQAHMGREVRALTGLAPGALVAQRGRSVQDG